MPMKQTTAQPTAAQRESVGQRIRRIRKLRGLTIEQLASLTRSSMGYISELENNPQRAPSLKKLRAFAEALEVDEGALLDEGKAKGIATEDEQFFARFIALPKETKRIFREIMEWYIRSRMR
jgi:transcriptional regulator with XRE-family HTH domain